MDDEDEVQDVPPGAAWEALSSDENARLVDVRTDAEWTYVGVPDLSSIDKRLILIEWQAYPTMRRNMGFEDELAKAGLTPENRIYFICRSGQRSKDAAYAALDAGFPNVFNVSEGFEGPLDTDGHRGSASGWKLRGLPWRQK